MTSAVGAVNPAKDFVQVSVQSMFVLVPRRCTATVVGMITNKLPAPPVSHNEALWLTCDAT